MGADWESLPASILVEKWIYLVTQSDLTTAEICLCHTLARYFRYGPAYPSQETLSSMTNLSRQWVSKLLGSLQNKGWIEKLSTGANGQKMARSEYHIKWPEYFDPDSDEWLQEKHESSPYIH